MGRLRAVATALAVRPIFEDWLPRSYPVKADRVLGLIRETRSRPHERPAVRHADARERRVCRADRKSIQGLSKKHGLDQPMPPLDSSQFTPPQPRAGQLRLF